MAGNKLAKVSTPRGEAASMRTLNPYEITVNYSGQVAWPGLSSNGIVRGTGADWFGPLNPMNPVAPPEVIGRQLDIAPGYNLVQTPRAYEPIGFPQLQALAQVYDILRLVIETRKDEVERLGWTIRPKDKELTRKSATIPPEMQARIDAVKAFFRKPDGVTPWGTWLRMLLEDLYVIDAPTLYCQRSRGGQLLGLLPLDGATIKRVIDDWGRTPQPYVGLDGKQVLPPAYQQVLKGLPAVNYSVRDLIYRPRNVRAGKIYGYSIVEQILMTINIGLRREMWQLSYFTEGNIPEAFIGVPDAWTPQQIKDYQTYFDAYFMGDLAARRRAKFVPGAMAKNVVQTKDPEMINAFDEWVARIVCFAFSISPQSFVKMMNRATGETAQQSSEETGLQPTKQWLKSMMDDIIEGEFASPDLQFLFEEEEEIDQEKQSKILDEKTKGGRMTLNEAREADGLTPYDATKFPAADTPMVWTSNGFIPIDANTIEGKKAMLEAMPLPEVGTGFGGENDDGESGKKPPPGKGKPGDGGEKKPGANPIGKHAHAHGTARFNKAARRRKRVKRLHPIPIDRPDTRKARTGIRTILLKLFKTVGPQVAAAVRGDLEKVAKAKETPEEKAQRIADELDLAKFKEVYEKVAAELGATAETASQMAMAQMGVDEGSELFDQVSEKSVAWARERAAELLGMKEVDGELVDNPNAEWSVTQSTRDMVRSAIEKGLEDNIGGDEIADNIEALGFSQERADLIARTEIANANSQSSLEGYKGARDDGVAVKKEWLLGPNPCEICEENAAAGPIDLDDEFPSGDDAPTAHPNCECALMPVVEVDDSSNQAETD